MRSTVAFVIAMLWLAALAFSGNAVLYLKVR